MKETTKLSEEIWMDEKAIGVDNHSNYRSEIEVDEETIQVRAMPERFRKFATFLLSFAIYSSFINANLILFYFRIAMYDAPEATSKKTLVLHLIIPLFIFFFQPVVSFGLQWYKGSPPQQESQVSPIVIPKHLSKHQIILRWVGLCLLVNTVCTVSSISVLFFVYTLQRRYAKS